MCVCVYVCVCVCVCVCIPEITILSHNYACSLLSSSTTLADSTQTHTHFT